MAQLAGLRRRLETEQHKVDSQIKHNEEQFSRLHDAAQQRKGQMKRQAGAVDGFDKVRRHATVPRGNTPAGVHAPLDKTKALAEFNALKYDGLQEGTAKRELLQAFPEPPRGSDALDVQQRALIHEQDRELASLRRALGGQPAASASGRGRAVSPSQTSMVSMASVSSFNVDAVAARNEERLRRLAHATHQRFSTNSPDDILEDFLNRSPHRSLMPAMREGTSASLMADTSYRPATQSSGLA